MSAPERMQPRGKPFKKGNPGRRPGSRNRAMLMNDVLTEDETNELILTGIRLAKNGDRQMVRFFLERLIPREQPVKLTLSPIKNHQDVADANARIIAAVSAGEILPSAAAALTAMIANIGRTLSDAELEEALMRQESMMDDAITEVDRHDQIPTKVKA
jgi:hypothetical protein